MKTCYRSVKTHTHGTHVDCLLLQKSICILLSLLAFPNPAIPIAAGWFAIGQMLTGVTTRTIESYKKGNRN